jgi:hypothetical protein
MAVTGTSKDVHPVDDGGGCEVEGLGEGSHR